MPPSLKIDNTGITSFEEFDTDRRVAVQFPTYDQVSFTGFGPDNNGKVFLKNVAIPGDNYDAANKKYVDDKMFGLSYKEPVRVVSLTHKDLATGYQALEVVDGVQLTSDGRPLVDDCRCGLGIAFC